jgi:hypothetical protein
MNKQSKAKEWADVEEWAEEGVSSWDVCLIDLRDQLNELSDDSVELSKSVAFTNRAICRRLEKLEEAARAAAKYPEKPDSFQMPSQEQVDYWVDVLGHRSDLEVFAMAAKWGYEQAVNQ